MASTTYREGLAQLSHSPLLTGSRGDHGVQLRHSAEQEEFRDESPTHEKGK